MGPRKGRALEGGEAFHNVAKFFLFLPISNCCGSTMIIKASRTQARLLGSDYFWCLVVAWIQEILVVAPF